MSGEDKDKIAALRFTALAMTNIRKPFVLSLSKYERFSYPPSPLGRGREIIVVLRSFDKLGTNGVGFVAGSR